MLLYFQDEVQEGRRVEIGALDDLGVYGDLWLPDRTQEITQLTDAVLMMAIHFTFLFPGGVVLRGGDVPLPRMLTARQAVASNH